MLAEQPAMENEIAKGNLAPIKRWLNEKIHQQGKRYTPEELVRKITGEGLNPDHFIGYLKAKYGEIYSLTL